MKNKFYKRKIKKHHDAGLVRIFTLTLKLTC